MGWLVIGFVSGTFFGLFVMALAQAARTDARVPTPWSRARTVAATVNVEDGPVALDTDPYATAATGSYRQHTG